MMKNKFINIFSCVLICSQLVACQAVKDRFIVDAEPVETEPVFGIEETEINDKIEETESVEETKDKIADDTTGSFSEITSKLGIMSKGETVYNIKDSLKSYISSTGILVKNSLVGDVLVSSNDIEYKSESGEAQTLNQYNASVSIEDYSSFDETNNLVNLETDLNLLGYTLNAVNYTVYYNDYDINEFRVFDLTSENKPFNTTKLGNILTGLNEKNSENVKYMDIELNYITSDNLSSVDINLGVDFNNEKVLYIGFNLSGSDRKDITYTSENLKWSDIITEIESGKLYYDGLYECSITSVPEEREVEVVEDSENKNAEKTTETVNKLSSVYVKYYASSDDMNYVKSVANSKGSVDDTKLESVVNYLGEVSVNNKPIDIAKIINSKDFSIATSNLSIYGAEPYRVDTYILDDGLVSHDVNNYDEVKSLYNSYKNLLNNGVERLDFCLYAKAPGDLTFKYSITESESKVYFVNFVVYHGLFEADVNTENILEEPVLLDSDVNNIKSVIKSYMQENGVKKVTDDMLNEVFSNITYIKNSSQDRLIPTTTDVSDGVKYTIDKVNYAEIDLNGVENQIENGNKYSVKLEDNSYSLGRFWY